MHLEVNSIRNSKMALKSTVCQDPSTVLQHHVPKRFLKVQKPFSWLKNPVCNVLNPFDSKRNPSDFLQGSFQNKKVQKGFLVKTMVLPSSRTFWEHGAREHLMVLGKIAKECFQPRKKIFLTAKKAQFCFHLTLLCILHEDTTYNMP